MMVRRTTTLAIAAVSLLATRGRAERVIQNRDTVSLTLAVMPERGPLVTQLEPSAANRRPNDRPRHVRLAYRWQNALPPGGADASLALVLRVGDRGREFEQGVDSRVPQLRQASGQFGSNWSVDLDVRADVPSGAYDAFLRVRQDGRTIGDGIGCPLVVP